MGWGRRWNLYLSRRGYSNLGCEMMMMGWRVARLRLVGSRQLGRRDGGRGLFWWLRGGESPGDNMLVDCMLLYGVIKDMFFFLLVEGSIYQL